MNKNHFRKSVCGKNASLKKGIVAFILAAILLLSLAAIVSAHPSQEWKFHNDNVMYKSAPPSGGNVPIDVGT